MTGGLVLTTILLVPVAGWLAVTVHELGHWAGALLVRFRTLLVVVWPLRIQRQGERLRLGTAWNLSFIGGMVACLPRDTRHLHARMAALTAGGPLASLLLGTAALWVLWQAWDGRPAGGLDRAGWLLALLVGIGSLLVGISSLWPRETGGYRSDGARLVALRRHSPTVDQEFAAIALSALSLTGVRPRDWDPQLVARAARDAGDPLLALAGRHLAWAWHLDHGRVEEARGALGQVLAELDTVPPELAASAWRDAAWFTAWHDHDPARARELLALATSTLLASPHERPLAEAAIALREGRTAEAATWLDRAEQLLPQAMDRGQAIVARERVEGMRGQVSGVRCRVAAGQCRV